VGCFEELEDWIFGGYYLAAPTGNRGCLVRAEYELLWLGYASFATLRNDCILKAFMEQAKFERRGFVEVIVKMSEVISGLCCGNDQTLQHMTNGGDVCS